VEDEDVSRVGDLSLEFLSKSNGVGNGADSCCVDLSGGSEMVVEICETRVPSIGSMAASEAIQYHRSLQRVHFVRPIARWPFRSRY
jgi:hypothetical protein